MSVEKAVTRKPPMENSDVIVTLETWDGASKRWLRAKEIARSDWPVKSRRPRFTREAKKPRREMNFPGWNAETGCWEHHLKNGGRIRLFASFLDSTEQEEISNELRRGGGFHCDNETPYFRHYRIQAQNEPRTHFLLHDEATPDFEQTPQPGYKYGHISLKSRPLSLFPSIARLSQRAKLLCNVPSWNVGINPVLYRDGNDHIGFHSDDDQGEQVILTAVVESPPRRRPVIIQPKGLRKKQKEAKREIQHGDERITLHLRAGDVYEMDGTMQRNYVHGVPKDKTQIGQKHYSRAVIVFRYGKKAVVEKDSGKPVGDLQPRDCSLIYRFGRIPELEEGCVYTKLELVNMKAHRALQAGVSGSQKHGCDAVCMGGRPNYEAFDQYSKFFYTTSTSLGAGAIITSAKKDSPIRVFRGSGLRGEFKALETRDKGGCQSLYRYDGLYKVRWVCFFNDNGQEQWEVTPIVSDPVVGRWYHFLLERIPKGNNSETNNLSDQEILTKSRTVNETLPDLAEGFNLSFYSETHNPPFPKTCGLKSLEENPLRLAVLEEGLYSIHMLSFGVYAIRVPLGFTCNNLDCKPSPQGRCIVARVNSLTASFFFRVGDEILYMAGGWMLVFRSTPKRTIANSKRRRAYSKKPGRGSTSKNLSALTKFFSNANAHSKEAMRDCILRIAVYNCETEGPHGEPFLVDGVEYPDLRKAVGSHGGLQPCPTCRHGKQGAYYCRFRKKHIDQPDLKGGRASSVILAPLFDAPLESLQVVICKESSLLSATSRAKEAQSSPEENVAI